MEQNILCIIGIMRYLRWNGKPSSIFIPTVILQTVTTLDIEIKRLQSNGIAKKKQAEPLMAEEEQLWAKGVLGDDTP